MTEAYLTFWDYFDKNLAGASHLPDHMSNDRWRDLHNWRASFHGAGVRLAGLGTGPDSLIFLS
jgi:hypothetical protein